MRHVAACFVLASLIPIPVLGAIIVVLLGYVWEYHSHGGEIPDDEDTQNDISNNIVGAVLGNIVSILWWGLI